MFKKILKLVLLGFAFALIFVLLRQPSLDRDWTDDAQTLPHVTIENNLIHVEYLRDWRYKAGETISYDYYDETFDLNKISKVYFLMNPFGKWEGVGHAFFVFEFEDDKSVAVSVEARRENGEPFGAVRGLFNNFELWYTWGSPADLMSRRAIYHQEDLYMYPLLIKKETVQGLFVDLARTTQELETTPRFYNTITTNCTNVLADSANRVNKGSIPWTWARIFTGYADNKLYELGLIPHKKTFEEEFENARVDKKIKEIFEEQDFSKEGFWINLNNQF